MTMQKHSLPVSDSFRGVAIAGFSVIILTFGVLGGWAATAPLDSAVVAGGLVTSASNRKTVQHFEGGMISEIRTAEGRSVKQGEVLFVLDSTQARAGVEIILNQLHQNLAREARLSAEILGASEIAFPAELDNLKLDPSVIQVLNDQKRQFEERRNSLEGQIAILRSRREQLRTEIEGVDREHKSTIQQVAFLEDELTGLRTLYEKGLQPKSRLLALEREKARLDGNIGRLTAERAKAESGVGEAELQIQQLRQRQQEEVGKELVDVREKINDLRQRLPVARDVFRRLEVLAPTAGTIQNLKFFTTGAVIRAGEPLLDIVPANDDLIVQAHVSPLDVNSVTAGSHSEVRFPSFKSRALPTIFGNVTSISQDRLMDEATKQPYFLALIKVDTAHIPEEFRSKLTPGLNAEIILPTGERTVLAYLIDPLRETLRKTFREK